MDKIDFQERKWGFVFGIIAMIAAVLEMIVNGISASSILGALKDIFGTMVVVVVFFLVIKNMPKKPKNLLEILETTVETWGLENAPLIFKTIGYTQSKDSVYTQGFVLLQNPKSYPELAGLLPEDPNWIDYAQYKSPKKLTGKFLDLPDYKTMTDNDFDVLFVMEQKHFKDIGNDEFIRSVIAAINKKYDSRLKATREGNSLKFKINYKRITTINDVEFFKDSLDYVLSLVKVIA